MRIERQKIDNDGNVYGLGIMEQGLANNPHDFPTQSAWGYFNKDYDPNTGNDQTDVTLTCFKANRTLFWASTYGSRFDHIGNSTDYTSDYPFRFEGCDWGHDLVLIDGQALYWVGSTGGTDLDIACPGATLSWCEDQLPYAHGGDLYHGFVARMNLSGLSIGVVEGVTPSGSGLLCFPSVSNESVIFIADGTAVTKGTVRMYDALGKRVIDAALDVQGSLSIASLAQGSYQALVFDLNARLLGTVRFVKQQ